MLPVRVAVLLAAVLAAAVAAPTTGQLQPLFEDLGTLPRGIVALGTRLYFAETGQDRVISIDYIQDGGDRKTHITGLGRPLGIGAYGDDVMVMDSNPSAPVTNSIIGFKASDPNSASTEVLDIDSVSGGPHRALRLGAEHFYYCTASPARECSRLPYGCDMIGCVDNLFMFASGSVFDMDVDEGAGNFYYSDASSVYRGFLDGSPAVAWFDVGIAGEIKGVRVDAKNGHLYALHTDSGTARIYRAVLGDTPAQELIWGPEMLPNLLNGEYLELDYCNGYLMMSHGTAISRISVSDLGDPSACPQIRPLYIVQFVTVLVIAAMALMALLLFLVVALSKQVAKFAFLLRAGISTAMFTGAAIDAYYATEPIVARKPLAEWTLMEQVLVLGMVLLVVLGIASMYFALKVRSKGKSAK